MIGLQVGLTEKGHRIDEAAAWRGVEEGPTPEQMSTRHLGNSSGVVQFCWEV